ncbi:hypothetical protein A3841_01420 [Pontibacter flavimaris]|uniref:Uncharacterized protein n=1 Tax=Pontibacter flavimaris TaxID=1797110 RepID=A0A1Q5PBJ6_9BACT|nr:hypothetical protein A3841_01420 [Pontibacter flavimaris]
MNRIYVLESGTLCFIHLAKVSTGPHSCVYSGFFLILPYFELLYQMRRRGWLAISFSLLQLVVALPGKHEILSTRLL